jgi:hypothetical protein
LTILLPGAAGPGVGQSAVADLSTEADQTTEAIGGLASSPLSVF